MITPQKTNEKKLPMSILKHLILKDKTRKKTK
jgi:hypothetical protein